MSYTSWTYYVMIVGLLIIYYILPKRIRWICLFAGSIYFYKKLLVSREQLFIFALSVATSYLAGMMLEKIKNTDIKKRAILIAGIVISVSPLLVEKLGQLINGKPINNIGSFSFIVPVGLSFYSLQIIAYLVDIYKGKIEAQKNPLKYALFITFFPQIIQGPIPRYGQIQSELFDGNEYSFENIVKGIQLVIWGLFLKFMIADKAAIVVTPIFENYQGYSGFFLWVAAILYSFQLYTDFLSCTTLSIGVANMFGIHLSSNFNHPYFSESIKEFWRRWHMSLSYWLRDYIYIPLGGSKNGRLKKWLNVIITFLISGLWHGGGWKFIIWGLLHGVYQIIGEIRFLVMKKMNITRKEHQHDQIERCIKKIGTFFLVMIGWVIFRAETLPDAIEMIKKMIRVINPWILFNDSLLGLGLGWKEWDVLFMSLLVLLFVSTAQEKGLIIREWICEQNIFIRFSIYLIAIWIIWIFGTYGYGYDARDFIYGGF
ncbi:MBOAT family O-acyltransferase [Pseudobutyrivibrio xylanivorans]|uniref:D-alanyl-lipoteichoic acid acyltransferase DltB, MBOAT superfamily n=1 Tax=Pseudobutyrivibrio xylanivorans DSM 14809 TaxID=1123012 RepID=A0A1M6GUZ2_PSEXY|nr:MBOAT family O-acyltransferase [Pseudobutyrivibrio xylanivorans]SHJ13739.1 D-alanyl-lipoteichoic acid acyltransferase DltB, MBOAT superfamily [Pseudobutyrivibrio xylanivorans DSM 14809]